MGVYQPANRGLGVWARTAAARLYRSVARRERAYILPWVASSDLSTFVLLENNQIEYSRRRRGLATDVAVDVTRYGPDGQVRSAHNVVVRPGSPVVLRADASGGALDHGFYQLTDISQFYVQIVGPGSFALTHGRSTVITHFPAPARPFLQAIARVVRPYKKGFNFIYTATLYETILIVNLSSLPNVIELDVSYSSGKRVPDRVTLPPFGSSLKRFNEETVDGEAFVTGFAHMRSTGPFDFYVLQTRRLNGREAFSIQHVN